MGFVVVNVNECTSVVLTDLRLPVRTQSHGQPAGEGDPVHCDATAVGYAPDRALATPVATAPVPQGDGATRLDTHAAQRVAPALSSSQFNKVWLGCVC